MGLDHEHEEPGEQEREDRQTAEHNLLCVPGLCSSPVN